jgi:hypothetical protein
MSKGILLTVAVILSVSFPSYATTWFDNFESYTVGDDLGDYPDWTNDGMGFLEFVVDEYGGSRCICGEWPRYYYEPPGELTDSRVSFDFLFGGSNVRACAIFRYDPNDDEGYIAVCWNDYWQFGGDDYLIFGYVMQYGDAFLLPFFSLGDYFEEGVWYHLDASVWGSGEGAYYEMIVDDDAGVLSSIPDSMPEFGSGYCGVTVGSGPNIVYIDNYEVDDSPTTGIQPSSLGALKAAFR